MYERGAGKGRYPEALIAAAAKQVCICQEPRADRMTPRQIAVEILDAAFVDKIIAGHNPWATGEHPPISREPTEEMDRG